MFTNLFFNFNKMKSSFFNEGYTSNLGFKFHFMKLCCRLFKE